MWSGARTAHLQQVSSTRFNLAQSLVDGMDTPSSSGIESGASRGPAGPALARASHSRFVQRVRRRWEGELPLLPAGVPKRASIDALIDRLQQEGRSLPSAMRVARQLVIERLAVLDVERGAALEDVTTAMTELAEVTLNRALAAGLRGARHALRRAAQRRRHADRLLGRRHGQARRPRAQRVVGHRPRLRLRGRRLHRRRRADQRARILLPPRPQPVHADRRRDRGRLRVPRRSRAAPERQLGSAGRQPLRCSRSTCRCRDASGSASHG